MKSLKLRDLSVRCAAASLALAMLVSSDVLAQSGSRGFGSVAPVQVAPAFTAPTTTFMPVTAQPVTAFQPLSAPCNTCATPTVAFSPVVQQQVVQPTVAYRPYTGWYPGKWLDQWRLRRAGLDAPTAAASTTVLRPTFTQSTTAFRPFLAQPTYAQTTAFRPVLTPFAPLATPVSQTVARQVVLSPVVSAPVCNTCNFAPACDACSVGCSACSTGCDACSTGVTQAAFTQPSCPSCAAGSVVTSGGSVGGNVGPQTPQPSLSPTPAPADSQYRQRPVTGGSGTRESEKPVTGGSDPLDEYDPGPALETDSSTYYNAPRLLGPDDRTARSSSRKPTVNVWQAVYRKTPTVQKVSQTVQRSTARTQAEIDAEGWVAVPPSAR